VTTQTQTEAPSGSAYLRLVALGGMGAAPLPALPPGFMAAAIGYVILVGFGDWGGLNAPGLVVSDLPAYDGVHVGDLAIALIVGVATALCVVAVRAPRVERRRTPPPGRP
jgi:hypothetical protein